MPRFRPAILAVLLTAPKAQADKAEAVVSDSAGQLSKYLRADFFGSNTTQKVDGGTGSACHAYATELRP